MIKSRWVLSLCVLVAAPLASAAPGKRVLIEVRGTPPEALVRATYSVGQDPIDLQAAPGRFSAEVALGGPSVSEPFFTPVDIVAHTSDGRPLQLYARLWPADANHALRLVITVPDQNRTTLKDLERLDQQFQTSDDLATTINVYVSAREIYRHWAVSNPRHVVGIRAAKLWFDAAYRLAAAGKTPRFRMDQRARDVVEKLELQAATDSSMAGPLRQVVAPGYVAGMTRQLDALAFKDMALVPDLMAKGELAAAKELNDNLLQAFSALSDGQQSTAKMLQGVTLEQLMADKKFIAAVIEGSGKGPDVF